MTTRRRGVEAWSALLRSQNAALRAIEADLAAVGAIPLSWYDVLLELRAAPDQRLRMQSLSDRVVLSRTCVSRLVDELVSVGLVERHPDPADGRAQLAAITDAGAAALRRTAPTYLAAIERRFSSLLDDEELALLADALGRVADAHRTRPD